MATYIPSQPSTTLDKIGYHQFILVEATKTRCLSLDRFEMQIGPRFTWLIMAMIIMQLRQIKAQGEEPSAYCDACGLINCEDYICAGCGCWKYGGSGDDHD